MSGIINIHGIFTWDRIPQVRQIENWTFGQEAKQALLSVIVVDMKSQTIEFIFYACKIIFECVLFCNNFICNIVVFLCSDCK